MLSLFFLFLFFFFSDNIVLLLSIASSFSSIKSEIKELEGKRNSNATILYETDRCHRLCCVPGRATFGNKKNVRAVNVLLKKINEFGLQCRKNK